MYNLLKPRQSNFLWLILTLYWLGLCVVSFFTLTLWYNQVSIAYVSHTLLQGILGFVLSIPLMYIYHRIWDWPLVWRSVVAFFAVTVIAAVWTVMRIETFRLMTDEQHIWADFGGWYFAAFFVFLCWSTLFHGLQYARLLQSEHELNIKSEAATRTEQIKRMVAEAKTRDAQLKMLRYQLNPHFLFNTLNAINSLIQLKEDKKAQRMIVQLSQFLRFSLDHNPETKIPLVREVDALMLYLEIEKTRFGERLVIDFSIDDKTADALIPNLLLQPLIENSMKYAISKSEDGGTIRLRTHLDGNRLLLDLSDSGSPIKINKSKLNSSSGRGIGLKNTAERLKNLYGENYSFDLNISSSGGLETVIKIPYETLAVQPGHILEQS